MEELFIRGLNAEDDRRSGFEKGTKVHPAGNYVHAVNKKCM